MIQSFKLIPSAAGRKMPVYMFQIDDLLLDTGPRSVEKQVRSIVKDIHITRVIHTHHHEDHTGNSAWIQKEYNLPQWIHPVGVSMCQRATRLPFYRAFMWHNRDAFFPTPLEAEYVETDFYRFKVVHTPGHAEDHIVLIDEEKAICFTGDLYLFHSPVSNFSFESVPEIIRSLDKVLTYSFQDIYCSHRGYIRNGRKLLERKHAYLLELQERVVQAFQAGRSPKQIRKELLPKSKWFQYISFFENSSIHTVQSILKEL
ncbi:MBL fold metallo-hydrolase [Ectobacillus antri]|uniref:MBL fold metallo-hydrolase n=1 Tax=Ectobacillus antri TaxID=2486280 RepID=UPI0013DDCBA1|nr:MBL fold metallo-hydrolase [Ectobacillus antri]